MSVYNGSHALKRTVGSVLDQTFSDFEFIIVDDGSTDDSLLILQEFAESDSRIRLIVHENQGLTHSLNIACRASMSEIIARQDVGDSSLPTRFQKQLEFLNSHPTVVAIGCGARRITERGEFLGESIRKASPEKITQEVRLFGTGILHPASMFRKQAFISINGYRPAFRFAQDTDLWLRLSELGNIGEVPEVLFELVVDDHGISASRADQQVLLWRLARKCAVARMKGESEEEFLKDAATLSAATPMQLSEEQRELQKRKARYFIGSQLYQVGNPICRQYFRDSVKVPALTIPSLAKIVLSFMKCPMQ